MSNIDQRVVQMHFDNAQFEQGAATTLGTLDKLNKTLKLQEATKGLADIGSAASKISMNGLAAGLDTVSSKFNAMSVIGITALSNITNKAVDAGIRITKSLTIDPIKDGFTNYETQINSVQTILANTAAAGTKLPEVNKALAELNTYANQTVYNFSDMTKNIGTFTAAGVGLQTSVNSIKGIANLAAMSGATSEQASSAMYQLSQAIAAGSVKLQDWNSVVNAGLGGKTFQTALENTARASGVAIDSIIKKSGSFRESLQEGWLTSDILTKTLAQFTGDLSLAQIKAMGYTDAQAKQILALGKTAVDAATKIKTGTQLVQALKEEVATAYGAVFKTIFGDINQATDFFTALHNVAENALTGPIYALNTLLEDWNKLGGRTAAIDGLKAAFAALLSVLKPIGEAFREVFPATTAKQLYDMTVTFRDFFERLKIGGTTADELKRTFAGFFAVFGIGWDVFKAVAKEVGKILGIVADSSGGFLQLTARMGDWIVNFKKAIEQGDDLTKFFTRFNEALKIPILLVQAFAQYIENLFDKIDPSRATKALDAVSQKLGPIGQLSNLTNEAWAALFKHMGTIGTELEPIAKKFVDFFSNVGHSIVSALEGMNFSDVLNVVNTGLFTGLLVLVKKFVTKFKSGGEGGIGGLLDAIKESFEGLTKTLETMQSTLKAATLLEIAAAIGILSIAVSNLSTIDAAGLVKSSAAITIMFTQLIASLGIFQKFIGTEGFLKLPFMMGSLILLASALDVMTKAVKNLAQLDWEGVSKGVTGLSVMLTVLAADVRLMGNPEHMIATGLGLTALSRGIKVLASVVVELSGLSWTDMAKGLLSVGGILTSLALFSKFAEADITGARQGAGIVLLAAGIKILASAMSDFSKFSWTEIAKGLVSMAGGLTLIGGALKYIPPSSLFSAAGVLVVASSLGLIGDAIEKMSGLSYSDMARGLTAMAGGLLEIAAALFFLPPSTLLSAAGIFIVASSLGMIGDALLKMGGMSWGEIAKSLTELAASLGIIAFAVILMEGTLAGSAAMLVLAAALAILTPVMKAFGDMSWTEILKSLVMLGGIFGVLGAAGLLLAPVTPIILALAGAITLLGFGVLATGAGLLLFSAGLTALSIAGAAGTAALVALITAMLGLLPVVATEIGLAIIAFAKVIATAGPAITEALVAVIGAVLDAIRKLTPKIIDTFLNMLATLLEKAAEYTPRMVDAGIRIILGFLEGVAQKMPDIIKTAVDLVVQFAKGISDGLPRLVQAGFDMMIKFINDLADSIVRNAPKLADAAVHLAGAIIDGMVRGLAEGASKVVSSVGDIATSALKKAGDLLGIGSPSREFHKIGAWSAEGFANGMTDSVSLVANASDKMASAALFTMSKSMATLSDYLPDKVDKSPTISPVLDLTNVKRDFLYVNDLFANVDPFKLDSTYTIARNISGNYVDRAAQLNPTPPQQMKEITFIQNNTSPKALSSADIYRQTKNQLSVARGVYVYQNGSVG